MNAIELMVHEHTFIKRMLVVARKFSLKMYNHEEVDFEDLYKVIDFVRNYADKHHHGKEEAMLFNKMVEEIGTTADKLVNAGMLVEHDLGRLFMQNLDKAILEVKGGNQDAYIDIIGNLVGYADLLNRHIDKEDGVVYKFAERKLSKETLEQLQKECEAFEKEQSDKKIQEKYINLLEELEEKVK
ncbi:MAG: hemerythrin domain-containing protein [Clostridiaceae bacterium]